jgi:defect-in-organelle-trafficking protein DotB
LPDNSGRTALREYLAFTPTIGKDCWTRRWNDLIPQAEILLGEYGQRFRTLRNAPMPPGASAGRTIWQFWRNAKDGR